MKLKSFKEKNNKKIGIILFTITCILLISGVLLYRTFAIFEVNNNFNIMNGKVEDPGDIYFAFYKDGVIQKEMPTKNEGYVLDENQSYCGVLGNKNPDIKVSMTDDEMIHILGVTTSRTKCNLYFVKGVYILGKGIPLVKEGNGLYEVKHDNVTGTANDKGFETTEYRYAGASPHNYITFNDETWRIIGLVNVMTSETTVDQRVKIVRNDSIGEYSWDSSISSINNGYGINEWSESDLMKLLNPGFETEVKGGSLYYNKKNGQCYTDRYETFENCDFTNTGLKEIYKNIIADDILWNTTNNDTTSYTEISTIKYYNIERRKESPKICSQSVTCNDNVTRNALWKGTNEKKALVGLIYPSDFGYAISEETDRKRDECLNKYMLSLESPCSNKNWLLSKSDQWLLTTRADDTTHAETVLRLITEGRVTNISGSTKLGVRPALYLKSNVIIRDGTGDINNTFKIQINL